MTKWYLSEQVILFLSDGKSTGNTDPREKIRDENQKYDNRIRIFTYLIGDGIHLILTPFPVYSFCLSSNVIRLYYSKMRIANRIA